MISKCVLNKNSNSDLRTQTQKLKNLKSSFSQTQQNPSHLKGNPANPSWSNLVADKYYCVSDLKIEEEKNSRFANSGHRAKGNYVTTDLSVSLNLVVRRTHPTVSSGKAETTDNCKRRRTEPSLLPFFLKPRSVDRQHVQSKVLEVSPNSIEDLDLELRLGNRPLVK